MSHGKQDLIDHVVAKGYGRRTAEGAVAAVLDGISALAAQDRLTLRGFGSFETRTRAARTGRNPRTGEAISLAASSSLAFSAARKTGN